MMKPNDIIGNYYSNLSNGKRAEGRNKQRAKISSTRSTPVGNDDFKDLAGRESVVSQQPFIRLPIQPEKSVLMASFFHLVDLIVPTSSEHGLSHVGPMMHFTNYL